MPRKSATPAAPAAPTTGKGSGSGRKPRVNRADFKYAVWVGNSTKPFAFCKTKDEANNVIKAVPTSKLSNVTVGELIQVTADVSPKW